MVRQVQRLQLQKYDLGGRDGADVLEDPMYQILPVGQAHNYFFFAAELPPFLFQKYGKSSRYPLFLQYCCSGWAKIQKPESVNTLSGGIDSTLTHIIMGNPKSVSGSYEHEKFLCEKEYALCAAIKRMIGNYNPF